MICNISVQYEANSLSFMLNNLSVTLKDTSAHG